MIKEILKAPTAAELARKLRRFRDDDIADIIIFLVGFTSLALLVLQEPKEDRSSTEVAFSVYACISPDNLHMLVPSVKDRTQKGD